MKSLLTTTALGALLAFTPALAQEQQQQPDAPAMQQPAEPATPEAKPGEPAAPDAAQPAQPAAPDVAQPAEPAAPDVAAGPAEVQFVTQQDQSEFLARDLLGKSVTNTAEESIGQINNIVFDEHGQMTTAVIGVGGFLGLGQKEVGVNFEALEITRDMDDRIQVILNTTREELDAAPDYMTLAQVRREAERAAPPQEPTPGETPGGAPAPGSQ